MAGTRARKLKQFPLVSEQARPILLREGDVLVGCYCSLHGRVYELSRSVERFTMVM